MSDLPVGWTETLLSTVVDILDSRRVPLNATERETRNTGKKQDELYPYYGATGQVGYVDGFIFDEPLILLGEDGVPFLDPMRPKAYLADGKYWVNNHAHVLRSIDGLSDRRYLCAFLNAYDYREKVTGTTRLKLTQEAMRSIQVSLAPFNEQKRIAEKLDSLLTRVDSCHSHLERVPQILKRFRQSVLAAATSGRLTEDWKEKHTEVPEYRSVTLREVATSFNYGTSAKSQKSGKVPVLRMGNIQDGALDWNDLVFTSDKDEIAKYKLAMGDVLFNRTNSPELVGKSAVYKGEQPAIYAGYLIRVKCGDQLLPPYLNYCLNSPAGRDWAWTVKSDGVSQSNINAQKLADFEFELPPLEEQVEIVRQVEKLFADCNRLAVHYWFAIERVEQLIPSVLTKAFHGELVEQDPNDEPASLLLERIKESRK